MRVGRVKKPDASRAGTLVEVEASCAMTHAHGARMSEVRQPGSL